MRSTRRSSANTRSDRLASPLNPVASAFRLEPVALTVPRAPGPLLPQIRAALAAEGEPLRWAITAVEPGANGPQLRIEAMVIRR